MHQRPAQGVAHRRRLDQEFKRIEPPVDGLRIGQRARQPLGEQARPCRRHGQVDRRQERAVARAAQGSRELEVGAGRRIDFEARPARAPGRRRERGPGLELGTLDISQRQGGGGDLSARKRAETVEGFDAVELADPALSRGAIAAVARERRRGNAHLTDNLGKQRFVVHRLRCDDLARLKPRDLRGEACFVRLAERDRPGRQIERGEPVNLPSLARARLLDGDQKTRPAGLEQPLLGDRPGSDQPNDVALDDRLRSPLFRLRRVFQLLADGDPMAERDQAVEVVVGALDWDPAHADVLAFMLAALREDNAQRPACDFRVFEEQLVEVAHPVEQQATRIDRLDFQILRHHRREARNGLRIGVVAGGVHRLNLANQRLLRRIGRELSTPSSSRLRDPYCWACLSSNRFLMSHAAPRFQE